MSNLSKLDSCAGSLMQVYAKEGEFAIVLRTSKDSFRLIGPQTDIPRLSEWLSKISDQLFDGANVVASKP